MPGSSPPPNLSHEVLTVTVQLQFCLPPATSSKSSSKKSVGKLEMKNKEVAFTFEDSEENYLSFLSNILKVHGYDKYTPVSKLRRFGVKIGIGAKKIKMDAVDIDRFTEYCKLAKKIIEEEPSKLIVYVSLEDVKSSAKRQGSGDSSSEGGGKSDKDIDDEGKGTAANAIERELACFRGLLEKKYPNPSDNGYTYVSNDGEKIPLTPSMMSEWARACYDGNTDTSRPLNSLSFDPQKHARSLFQTPKAASGTSAGSGDTMIHALSSIVHDVCAIFGRSGDAGNPPATPSNASEKTPASPAKYSPSKLPAFLQYAQDKLGVKDAMQHKYSLADMGFGPDILPQVNDAEIVSCGISAGNTICLKHGASVWWSSPEAKRVRPQTPPPDVDERDLIRFENRYVDGGCLSVFGPGFVLGTSDHEDEFSWWYYDQNVKDLRKVPDGFVPEIHAKYLRIVYPDAE